jgi:CheY-like chemotaxis protein
MSGDLLTLRLMVVCPGAAEEQQWRESATLASLPIEFHAERASDAVGPLKAGGFDIVIIDGAVPPENRRLAIEATRDAKPVPLVVVCGVDPDEAAFVVPQPGNAGQTRSLIELCVRMRLPKRALIVDDSRTTRGIVRKILSASRFALDISEAEEGAAAIGKLEGRYDLVLLDCNMPGLDGFDILAKIKDSAPNTTVVMMTATDDDALAGRARTGGADAFLKKPFYPADIDALLTRIYAGPR